MEINDFTKICFMFDTREYKRDTYSKIREHCYELERRGIGKVISKGTVDEDYIYDDFEITVPLQREIILKTAMEIAKHYEFDTIELWMKYRCCDDYYNSGILFDVKNHIVKKITTIDNEWDFMNKYKINKVDNGYVILAYTEEFGWVYVLDEGLKIKRFHTESDCREYIRRCDYL